MYTEKERIKSGYFLHHAELKKKDQRREKKEKRKSASFGLGAMFEMDSCANQSNSSSNHSDEDFVIPHKRKEDKT